MSQRYQDYLASEGWRRRRQVVVQLAHWTCQRCGWNVYAKPGRWIEVHHLSYERLGDELVGDVEVLCSVCHAERHHQPPREAAVRGLAGVADILPKALEAIR